MKKNNSATKIDYSKIDRTKFISDLWKALHDMAFLDIKRASDGKSKMGAFILASCFIDYLAGFRYGKNNGDVYKNFVRTYFKGKYNAEKLYGDLRSRLVHNYTEGGSYIFIDNRPDLHHRTSSDNRTVLNLENFIEEIEEVLKLYFIELENDEKIYNLALERYSKIGIMGVQPLFIKNPTIEQVEN